MMQSLTAASYTMTMNINITPQLEEMVRMKVSSGMYNSASEVVRDALRMMAREDAKTAQLRADITDGIASSTAGTLDAEAIKSRGRKRLAVHTLK